MADKNGKPGQSYRITVSDGIVVRGSTDAKGRGTADGIDAGNCNITLTRLDMDAWKKK